MASFNVIYNIIAQDKFSSTGKKFASVAGRIKKQVGRMNVSLDRAKQKFKSLDATVGKAGRRMAKFGKGMSGKFSLAAGAFAGNALRLFNVQAQANAKVQALITTTGGAAKLSLQDLQKEASKLQRESLFGDEAILDSMAQLLTFTDIKGSEFKRTQKMVMDLSTVLKTDMKSSAILLGKALNDPAKGMSMMTRVGIKFTDSQVDVIKAMQASGDLMGAQNSILKILEGQYGGTAKAASLAGTGPITQLAGIIGDVNEKIGKQIMIIIRPFIALLKKMAIKFDDASPRIKKMVAILALVITVVFPIIAVLGTLLSILPFVAAGFALISLPVILIGIAIAAVITIVVLLITYWDELMEALASSAILAGLKAGFMALISPITILIDAFEKIISFDFSSVLGDIGSFFGFGDAVAEINSNNKSESKVDVNLNAPSGTIQSVKTRSSGNTQMNVGTNMMATAQ